MAAGYEDLVAWRKAMDLVTALYTVVRSFPKEERWVLGDQLRRAAISVPSNIAEGYGRNSRAELHQFLGIARGSLAEIETQVRIAKNLGYIKADVASGLLSRTAEVGRLLTGLRAWSAHA